MPGRESLGKAPFQDCRGDLRGKPGERQDATDSTGSHIFALSDLGNRGCPSFEKIRHPAPCISDKRDQVRVATRCAGLRTEDNRSVIIGNLRAVCRTNFVEPIQLLHHLGMVLISERVFGGRLVGTSRVLHHFEEQLQRLRLALLDLHDQHPHRAFKFVDHQLFTRVGDRDLLFKDLG